MTQASTSVRATAAAAARAGIVVLPAKPDGSKQPGVGKWREYQRRQPTADELRAWFTAQDQDGMGFLCGEVSGGLEMLEFEDEGTHAAFVAFAAASGLGDIVTRIAGGYEERTPGGGTHWFYRIPGHVQGNTKLASKPCPGAPTCTKHEAGKPHVLVETRGAGGWVVVAPSAGRTHETGLPYVLASGGVETITTLTEDERAELWALARTFDKMPQRAQVADSGAYYAQQNETPTGERPGDLFNARASWADVLAPHGWTWLFQHGDLDYWRRPGKQRGVSATTGRRNPGDPTSDLLWVFTTSTELEAEAGYSKWRAYAALDHGGDYAAAARALHAQGYTVPRNGAPTRQGGAGAHMGTWVDEATGEVHEAPPAASEDGLERYAHSLVDWATFWDVDHKQEEWLVEPILPLGRSVAMYSPAKAGKSLLTLDVAAALALGRRVLDKPAGPPLNVLYFDLEMTEGDLAERLEAMGYSKDTDLSHLSYYLLPNLPPLDTAEGGVAVRDLARKHNADLVIIDTTSRVISGGENDSDTMRAFYQHTGLPLKADGRTVWRLDHAGKDRDRGQRGTSAKNDDVDLVWELTSDTESVRLRATHRRQSWVAEHVDLVRLEGPLRHERSAEGWLPGAREIAWHLDRLNAPLTISTRQARALLKENAVAARETVLGSALRYRRNTAESDSQNMGITQISNDVTTDGKHRESDTESLGNHREAPTAASGNPLPPLGGKRFPSSTSGTVPNTCVDCGTPIAGGRARCEPCVQRRVRGEEGP